jgi:hypothetical protein
MRATYEGTNGNLFAGPPGRIGLISVYFIDGSVIPWSIRWLKHGRLLQRAMWLGPFQARKVIAGQSHSVPCNLAWKRGIEKPTISPRQPTPTIKKSNVVYRTQDLRLPNSTDNSYTCPTYTYLVRQLNIGLLFTQNHWLEILSSTCTNIIYSLNPSGIEGMFRFQLIYALPWHRNIWLLAMTT